MKKNFIFAALISLTTVLFALVSCEFPSIDQMLDGYNKEFSSDFGKTEEDVPKIIQLASLLPKDVYEVKKGENLIVELSKGYINYEWTLQSLSGKTIEDIDTGMYIVQINTNTLTEKEYTLTVIVETTLGTKYTDTAQVNVY